MVAIVSGSAGDQYAVVRGPARCQHRNTGPHGATNDDDASPSGAKWTACTAVNNQRGRFHQR